MGPANAYELKRAVQDSARKVRYQKRVQMFQGKKVTLWSIDGVTWSTKKEELLDIIERRQEEQARFGGQIKGGPQAGRKTPRETSPGSQAGASGGAPEGSGSEKSEAKKSAPQKTGNKKSAVSKSTAKKTTKKKR